MFLLHLRLEGVGVGEGDRRREGGYRARQHCHLTICIELVELKNSETAAATPSGGGARSLRSHSLLEKRKWRTYFGELALLYICISEWGGFRDSKFTIETLGRPFLSLFIK